MLKDAWFLAVHDLKVMLRQKETLLWTFLMPFVFFYFIGTVTGGFGSSTPGTDSIAVRVGEDAGFLADELVQRMWDQGFAVHRPDDDVVEEGAEPPAPFENYARQLEIPAGFTGNVLAGVKQEILFRRNKPGLATDYDQFRLSRAVYTVLADVLSASNVVTGDGSALADLEAADVVAIREAPRALVLDVQQAGTLKRIPTGFEQAVPGTMVMFTLIILLTTGATTLLIERREGLLRRLASAPIRRGAVVLGKWTGKLALAVVQIGFAMLIGRFVFGVDWGPNLAAVCLVLLSYAALIAGLGLLLGNFARSEGQAVGFGVLTGNVFAALGGCWWPIEVTSPFMQKLALFLPTGWTMDAMHKLVSFGAPATSVLPHVAGMLFAALVVGQIAARVFRFQN